METAQKNAHSQILHLQFCLPEPAKAESGKIGLKKTSCLKRAQSDSRRKKERSTAREQRKTLSLGD